MRRRREERELTESWPFPWKFDPSRYSRYYLTKRVTEAEVQNEVLEFLHSFYVDAVAIDAGGRRTRGRMIAAAKASGVALRGVQHTKTGGGIPKGFADVEATLAPRGLALYIEVKAPAWTDDRGRIVRPAGALSAAQVEFLLAKFQRGAFVMVAWSSLDVERFLGPALLENRKAILAAGGARA
jgi:hypothetical protein